MVEFRLLGGCVRVKSECNTTFQHLKHIALCGRYNPNFPNHSQLIKLSSKDKFKAKYLHRMT